MIINHHLIPLLKRMPLLQSMIKIFKVYLPIEIDKFLQGLFPAIIDDIIKLNRRPIYNLRTRQELNSWNPKTVRYGTETISFLAQKMWAIVPQNIRNCTSLSPFKINIRKWKPDCPCHLFKCFLKHVGCI